MYKPLKPNFHPEEQGLESSEDEDNVHVVPHVASKHTNELSWCSCANCQLMPSNVENVCCRSVKSLENIQRVLFVQYIKFQENVPGCGGTTNAPLCPP